MKQKFPLPNSFNFSILIVLYGIYLYYKITRSDTEIWRIYGYLYTLTRIYQFEHGMLVLWEIWSRKNLCTILKPTFNGKYKYTLKSQKVAETIYFRKRLFVFQISIQPWFICCTIYHKRMCGLTIIYTNKHLTFNVQSLFHTQVKSKNLRSCDVIVPPQSEQVRYVLYTAQVPW